MDNPVVCKFSCFYKKSPLKKIYCLDYSSIEHQSIGLKSTTLRDSEPLAVLESTRSSAHSFARTVHLLRTTRFTCTLPCARSLAPLFAPELVIAGQLVQFSRWLKSGKNDFVDFCFSFNAWRVYDGRESLCWRNDRRCKQHEAHRPG